jgi:hypothetical protein
MRQVYTREGWQALGASWMVLAAALLAGAAIVAGSHWYLQREKRDSASFARKLQEARVRVEGARRERDSLRDSADVFRTLVERGLLQTERRLDLVELVNQLRARYQLFALDYEISPQRPLVLGAGRTFNSVDVLASRVKLKARALHEGDILGFIAALSQTPQGFYPVDRCTLRRIEVSGEGVQPRIEAECSLEWITLKEKRVNRPS